MHVTKAYRGSRDRVPLILNLSTTWRWTVIFTPRPLYLSERTALPIDCTPGPVWTVRTRGNALFSTGTERPIRLDTIRTRLYNKFNHFPYIIVRPCILIVRPCILIVRPCILIVVYVFLLLSMYSYCSSMYSYRCLCILIVVYVFLDAATLTEVFPCFFLGCKANVRV